MNTRLISLFSMLVVAGSACTSDGGDDTGADSSSGGASTTASTTDSTTASTTASTTMSTTASEGSTTDASDTDASTSNGTDPTTGADGSTGTDTTGGGGEVEVRNTPETCNMGEVVSPILPDEASHMAATTLTPASYPFEVTSLVYDLIGNAGAGACDSTLAHRVEVYVIEGSEPPADPADAVSNETFAIEADEAAADERTVVIDLDTPITLTEGQSLVIAVEMIGNDDLSASVCVRACRDTGGIADLDWWSNAAEVPYAWADMVGDFGFISNFDHRMMGHTP